MPITSPRQRRHPHPPAGVTSQTVTAKTYFDDGCLSKPYWEQQKENGNREAAMIIELSTINNGGRPSEGAELSLRSTGFFAHANQEWAMLTPGLLEFVPDKHVEVAGLFVRAITDRRKAAAEAERQLTTEEGREALKNNPLARFGGRWWFRVVHPGSEATYLINLALFDADWDGSARLAWEKCEGGRVGWLWADDDGHLAGLIDAANGCVLPDAPGLALLSAAAKLPAQQWRPLRFLAALRRSAYAADVAAELVTATRGTSLSLMARALQLLPRNHPPPGQQQQMRDDLAAYAAAAPNPGERLTTLQFIAAWARVCGRDDWSEGAAREILDTIAGRMGLGKEAGRVEDWQQEVRPPSRWALARPTAVSLLFRVGLPALLSTAVLAWQPGHNLAAPIIVGTVCTSAYSLSRLMIRTGRSAEPEQPLTHVQVSPAEQAKLYRDNPKEKFFFGFLLSAWGIAMRLPEEACGRLLAHPALDAWVTEDMLVKKEDGTWDVQYSYPKHKYVRENSSPGPSCPSQDSSGCPDKSVASSATRSAAGAVGGRSDSSQGRSADA